MILKIPECSEHSLVQLVQVGANLLLAILARILELHAAQLVEYAAHMVLDGVPSDLVLRLSGGLDRVSCRVIEADQIVQHEH